MSDAHDSHEHNELFHVSSEKSLFTTLGILVFLTVLTWLLAQFVHLGWVSIAIALTIAVVKSFLVCANFMHLKYDTALNRLVVYTSISLVGIFFFYAGIDAWGYQDTMREKRDEVVEFREAPTYKLVEKDS